MIPRLHTVERTLWVERCRRSAQFFIFESGALVTKDEHDQLSPVKPFPQTLYLRALLDLMCCGGRMTEPDDALYAREAGVPRSYLADVYRTGVTFVEKSRQLMVTWLACAYCLWRARAFPHQLILVQSKKKEDAANLVFFKQPDLGRISFMEFHLPPDLRQVRYPLDCSEGRMIWPDGSQIWAIPEGGSMIRSNTPTVVFSDESAFQEEFGNSYTAALPAIKGGGQYLAVSSAEPGEFQALVGAA